MKRGAINRSYIINVFLRMSETFLTGGCWSMSRYSVFYVITEDGHIKVYDILLGIQEPLKTIRLCEDALKAIKPHEDGKLMAVGGQNGNVYLVESSEALTTNSKNDKGQLIEVHLHA